MSARRRLLPLLFALAGCSEPAGLRIDIDLAGFQARIATLRVTVTATPGGFSMPTASTQPGVTLSTQVDAATGQKLVMDFAAPYAFGGSMSFRLATGNHADRQVSVLAVASSASGEIAEGTKGATLPGGGHATVSLALVAHTGPPPSNVVDLAATTPDVVVKGGQQDAAISTVAVCDFDGDGAQDLVIGAPGADSGSGLGATGAVYVLFGPFTAGASINLADTSTLGNTELHIYGANGGDRLGASVACADLDKDGADDLIIGAPSANGGSHVYVAFGKLRTRTTTIKLQVPDPTAADIEWDAPSAARLGAAVLAANLDADKAAEVIVAAPGDSKVYLFSGGLNGASWPKGKFTLDGTEPAHVTFTGVAAAALGAGDLDSAGSTPSFPLDVILGDPTYPTSATQALGIVHVFRQVAPVAPAAGQASQVVDVATAALTLMGTAGSQFGTSVLAADLTSNGQDLYIGAPGDGSGNGAVHKLTHDMKLLQGQSPSSTTITGLIAGERFGGALAVDPGGTRLYVGASAANLSTRSGAGAAYVHRGDTSGTPQLLEQIVGGEANGHLGAALAAGLIGGGDQKADLLTAAPGATGADVRSGVAYVRFGR